VFATCGSPEKRTLLLERFGGALPAAHIGDSRSCAFEALVMRATAGAGVHLLLNSLAGDKLQARTQMWFKSFFFLLFLRAHGA
jgi:fatty acid synthase